MIDPPDHHDHIETLRELCRTADGLVQDLEGQRSREDAAFAEGYRLGYHAGTEVGHLRAHHEMEWEWAALAAKVRALARHPSHHELQIRRYGDDRSAVHISAA